MKKSVGIVLLMFMFMALLPIIGEAAPPPPPDPPGPPGPGSGWVWIGGSPVGHGLVLLISLALGYGARKVYNARKRKISE